MGLVQTTVIVGVVWCLHLLTIRTTRSEHDVHHCGHMVRRGSRVV
jgi:hypothetical protein